MKRYQFAALIVAATALTTAALQAGAQSRPADKAKTSKASAAAALHAGEKLFLAKCGYCHLEDGTGTQMLERRLGKDKALLGKRVDLSADYVKMVARNGMAGMPTITRVEANDVELDAIANFIAAKKKVASK